MKDQYVPMRVVHSSSLSYLEPCQVGTLDALMCLSDELAKLDVYTETIMQKVYHYMANTLENNDVAKLPEYSKCNNKVLYIVSRE